MKIRLIATDMDGTFLDDEKQIPEANWQALLACAARGIQIVPATGRTVRGIPDRIRTLPGVRYAITTNGAVVADLKEDRIISTCRIPVDTALRVLEMARDSGDDIMYDAYMDGIGCTTQYFYDHAERYAVSAGVAALIRKTRRVVPDNIRYVKEMGKEIDKINMFFTDMEARKRMRVSLGQIPRYPITWRSMRQARIKGALFSDWRNFSVSAGRRPWPLGTEKMICPCSGQPVWGLPWKMERSR